MNDNEVCSDVSRPSATEAPKGGSVVEEKTNRDSASGGWTRPPASTYTLPLSFTLAFYLHSLYSFSVAFSPLYQFSLSPLPPSFPHVLEGEPGSPAWLQARGGLPSAWCGRGTVAPPTSPPDRPPPLPPPFRFACPCVFFFVFLFCFSFAVTLFFFFSTSSFLNSRARGKVIQCRSVNNVVLMVLRIPFLRL